MQVCFCHFGVGVVLETIILALSCPDAQECFVLHTDLLISHAFCLK